MTEDQEKLLTMAAAVLAPIKDSYPKDGKPPEMNQIRIATEALAIAFATVAWSVDPDGKTERAAQLQRIFMAVFEIHLERARLNFASQQTKPH